MDKEEYKYSTERLLVSEWRSISSNEWNQVGLDAVVINTLTPNVTQSLPLAWQGAYSPERANEWIKERDEEGITLIVIDKSSREAIGLLILFEWSNGKHLRLGYLLKESAWGCGYASELVQGLVEWCKHNDITSITGGVEVNNTASKRVLKKMVLCEKLKLMKAKSKCMNGETGMTSKSCRSRRTKGQLSITLQKNSNLKYLTSRYH